MSNISSIRRTSQIMKWICTGLMLAIPLGVALTWLNIRALGPEMVGFSGVPIDIDAVAPGVLVACFLVAMVPAAIAVYGMNKLRRLFTLYFGGQIFALESVHCLRSFAKALFAYAVTVPLANAGLSVLLTLNNPPGQRMFQIGVGGQEIATLLIGGVILVIAWIMAEGHHLAEENQQIV